MSALTASSVFTATQKATALALFERLFPAGDGHPGAVEIGAVAYVECLLAGFGHAHLPAYQQGLDRLERAARARWRQAFAACDAEQQSALIQALEAGQLGQPAFMDLLLAHLQEGLFADPLHGGNQGKRGWQFLEHPGIWFENSLEEMLSRTPVTKGGRIQSMQDLAQVIRERPDQAPAIPPEFDPDRGLRPPQGEADVVLIGLGAMNSVVAPLLAEAGLSVVALEAGPYRSRQDYHPDELGQTYYGRARMGPKFNAETPRWRRNAGEPTQPCTFSLGRMMNGVGGSVFHYGGWMRRFHPHHFRARSRVAENGWDGVLPADSTLADWPVAYDDLEPYYARLEWEIGIAGVNDQPPVPRSRDLPMPPLRPYHMGEVFREATEGMGLHPYPVPAAVNSVPYRGRPATSYSCWTCGFGTFDDSLWHPAAECVPRALATGRLDLKTHCRAIEILADGDGRARGVKYVDPAGEERVQYGRCLILGTYVWESIRLLLLSRDARHPQGLGNNRGQVGQNLMTKMFAQVLAQFPDRTFNRHCANASQSLILDDFLREDFAAAPHGFLGGATISAEPQFLPLAISREALPPDVPRWGAAYKAHLRTWQHWGVLRIQPDTLPYATNFVDLDPRHRDRSGLGLPVIRITYDMRANEHRMSEWMESKCEEILRAMGGQNLWRGPRFTGVGSCHDLGGIRMGADPAASVLDPNLEVHDTPGLFVFGGGAFPSCPGINPTLTMMALCVRACESLIARLRRGDV